MGKAKRSKRICGASQRRLVLALLAAGTALSACSTVTTVASWAANNSLSTNDGQLQIDIKGLASGLKLHKLFALHTACEAFSADASTAYDQLPTPSAALTNALALAYDDFESAGQECYYAPSFSSLQMRRFEVTLAAGKAAFGQAHEILVSYGVK